MILPTDSTESQLIKLFESSFDSAKSLWVRGFVLDGLSSILSIAIIFTKSYITNTFVVMIIVFTLSSLVVRVSRRRTVAIAEEIRTTHLINNGLGNEILQIDVEHYKQSLNADSIRRFSRRPSRDSPYYDVSDPPGPERLLTMLHESAFFSWKIVKNSKLFYLGLFFYPLLLILISLLVTLILPKSFNDGYVHAQIIQVTIAFLLGFGIFESFLTLSKLENDLGLLNRRLSNMRIRGIIDKQDTVIETWKYALMQSHGEIIPNRLFRQHGQTILSEWNAVDIDIRRHSNQI
ncbi:hypothetical protein [Deinococcus arenicola]|uniref:SMODS and SLOG-associating 2TM effector domain-containing protein n=1 Tax=Deinococcus arenicola TaxID=2994950 RepID=A0ABU4DS53_9DEIO|nr:hypothetical protein [Deinococcus sp. ZS9-10]MDV6375250.1 hypothetical protein [Deinococcus sp. ZS9-10]